MCEWLAGLCRESHFTALASGATFAVQMIGFTIHQVRMESMGKAGQRAASLLNIMALWDDSTIISCYVKVSGGAIRPSPGSIKTASSYFQLKIKTLP